MRVAVLSDIHDNIWKLEKVLDSLECSALIMCGDFCAPFTLEMIAQRFAGPVHCVFGNNDGDRFLLLKIASRYEHVTLHGELATLELAGRRIAVNHYPEIAAALAAAGEYDAVFSGHNHQRHVRQVGNTLWANPGEVMGRFGHSTYGLYDTASEQFTHHEVT
jgi:hypothetical protein